MPQPASILRYMHRCRLCGLHYTKALDDEMRCPYDAAEFVVDATWHPDVKSSRVYTPPTDAERAAWERWRESQREAAPAPTNGHHVEEAEEVAVDTSELAAAAGG